MVREHTRFIILLIMLGTNYSVVDLCCLQPKYIFNRVKSCQSFSPSLVSEYIFTVPIGTVEVAFKRHVRHVLLRDWILNHGETSRFISHIFLIKFFFIFAVTLICWHYVSIIRCFFFLFADNVTTKEATYETK